jgi:YbbR domain-containing protein
LRKKIFLIIYSVLFAVFLWTSVNLNFLYNVNLKIPLEVKLRENQALADELPGEIEVVLRGRGWDLLGMWFSKDLNYVLDLNSVKRNLKLSIQQTIGEKINLPADVTVVGAFPDTLNIDFDNIASKYVKVKNLISLNLKEGYEIVGTPKIIPDSVKITGATSVLSKIKNISTEKKEYNNINSSLTVDIALSDSMNNMVKIEPKTVRIFYKIELAAEKKFEDLGVTIRNVPPDKEVLLIPPNLTLSLRGGVDILTKVTPSDFRIFIDYDMIEKDTLGSVAPNIEIPDNLILINFTPQKFQYIIKRKNG